MTTTFTPADMALRVGLKAQRERMERRLASAQRVRNAREHGYRGPLTRTEQAMTQQRETTR